MEEAFGWIAIVDDDPSVLKALTRSLRVRSMQTRTHGSAREFLAALADGLPECLILDLQLPEMTGLELLMHLKRTDITIPTIIVTAYGEAGVRERCEAAGAIAFLPKPLGTSHFSQLSMPRAVSKEIPIIGRRIDDLRAVTRPYRTATY
jgi:FixJ family two-component response regulator